MKEQFKITSIRREVSSMKEVRTKISKIWFIWFFAACAMSSLSLVVVFWHTNVYRDAVLAQLELKNGSQSFAWWKTPPVRPLLKIRIFNYTNVEEYEAGRASKLHVEEVGPYIYRETITKVNVRMNENGTVTYQEHTSHEWEGGRPDDEIIRVPNVPLMMIVKKAKVPYFVKFIWGNYATSLLSMATDAGPYKKLTVKEYIWGYSDILVDGAVQVSELLPMTEAVPYDKFGMLLARSGLSKDLITIHTGSGDINNLGLYQRLNGMKSRNVWNDKECDKLEGTDGSMFPPNLIRDRDATLKIYTRDICRSFPLRFDSFGTSFDIPTLRYKPTKDIFTSSNTTNSCFCQKTTEDKDLMTHTCPPEGIFNMTPCTFDLPFLFSFPHFYGGDKILLNDTEGLNPRQELHETYADIHPRLGITMGGWSRFQISVQASDPIKDGLILPLIWIEIGIDKIPEVVLTALWHAYYTVDVIESALQWGSLFCTILSICAMGYMTKQHTGRPRWQGKRVFGRISTVESAMESSDTILHQKSLPES